MATVYSVLLWEFPSNVTGVYDSGPVPAGFCWVVRDLLAFNSGADSLTMGGYYLTTSTGDSLAGQQPPFVQAGRMYHDQLHQVMTAGYFLVFNALDNGWTLRASGYQLTLP